MSDNGKLDDDRDRRTNSTGTRVQVRRRGRPGGSEEGGIDDRRKALDTCLLDRNDERRLRSIRGCQRKVWVVEGDEETDDKGTADVEQKDTNVHALDRLWQVLAWVLRFTGSNLG